MITVLKPIKYILIYLSFFLLNRLLFGTDESIVGVDYVNRHILINVSLIDFYGTNDPFHRGNRSPKKHNKLNESDETNVNDQVNSSLKNHNFKN